MYICHVYLYIYHVYMHVYFTMFTYIITMYTGTVEQCSQACSHLARIIKEKASTLLSKSSKHRRVPRGLKSAEMSILVAWLLCQTGLLETEARRQCRMLFTMLAPSSSSKDTKLIMTQLYMVLFSRRGFKHEIMDQKDS